MPFACLWWLQRNWVFSFHHISSLLAARKIEDFSFSHVMKTLTYWSYKNNTYSIVTNTLCTWTLNNHHSVSFFEKIFCSIFSFQFFSSFFSRGKWFILFFFRVQVCSSVCKYMCLENKSIFLPLHIMRSPRYGLKFNNEKFYHLHSIGNNLWCNWMCHSIRFYRIFELIWNRALSLISVKKRKIEYMCLFVGKHWM